MNRMYAVLIVLVLSVLNIFAQKPAQFSDGILQSLKLFDQYPTTDIANRFFEQLEEQEFTDGTISFTDASSVDSIKAQVWYWAGEYLYSITHYQEAETYAVKALNIYQNCKEEEFLADCLNLVSICNIRLGNFKKAIDYAKQVYELDKKSGDPQRISMSLNTLSGIYLSAGQPLEAEQFVKLGLQLAKEHNLTHRMGVVQGMASEVYHALGRDTLAVYYAEQAYQFEVQHNCMYKAMIRLSQKGSALIGLQRYQEANDVLATAISYFRENDNQNQSLGISLNKQGRALMELNRPNEAKACFREAAELFLQMGDRRNEMHARLGLYNCLYKSDPDSARTEMNRFVSLRDSLYNLASAESLAKYQAEFGHNFLEEKQSASQTPSAGLSTPVIIIIILAAILLVSIISIAFLKARRYRRQITQLVGQIENDREKQEEPQSAVQSVATPQTEAETAAEQKEKAETNAFLEKTNAVIRKLMPHGQVDTPRVASELCMSVTQFRRKIQAATGLTAASYILAIRMDEAHQLLALHPKYNINDIAIRCGFADNAHFTHTYKRVFHITPMEYIKQVQNKKKN